MQDVGPDVPNDFVEPTPQIADDRKLARRGQLGCQPGRLRGTEELPVADPLARRRRLLYRREGVMFTARDEAPAPSRERVAD